MLQRKKSKQDRPSLGLMLMGLWKRPLLQSVHAGLMTPQYDGPEIPSYVHHASQLALASGGNAVTRTIRARSGTILLRLADTSRSEAAKGCDIHLY